LVLRVIHSLECGLRVGECVGCSHHLALNGLKPLEYSLGIQNWLY
jgi:hypothetical protein